jgi:MFS transporter, FSR family, fosmidomycin resistance protein
LTRDEKRILGLTAASHNMAHLFEGVLPPLIPILLLEFGTDYFHLGIVVTIFSYGFGLGALPAGYLSDRFGPKPLIIIYLLGSGLFFIGVFTVNTLIAYGVIMGIIGLFCSLYHPAANALIARTFQQKGKAFAINGIAGSLGVAIAPVLSASLGSAFGWKTPHIVYGIMGMALGWYAFRIRGEKTSTADGDTADKTSGQAHRIPYFNLILFYITAGMLGITYKGIMTFLPAYMAEQVKFQAFGLTPVAIGGTFATFALMFGAIGQYVAGRLSDRYQPEKIYAGGLVIGAVFVFMMAKSTNILLVISAVIYAFFYFSTQPTQNYLIASYLPKNRQGMGFGIHFFLTFGVGSTAAAVSGYIADRFGLTAVFYIMGCFFTVAAALSLIMLIRSTTRIR